MTPSTFALAAFVLWTILLILPVLTYRSVQVLAGNKKADEFPAWQTPEGPGWYQRATRAHLNCVENLPLFAALVLTAIVTSNEHITDPLAWWFLGARIVQSTIHLARVNHWFVQARFAAYLVQIGIMGWIAMQLLLSYQPM